MIFDTKYSHIEDFVFNNFSEAFPRVTTIAESYGEPFQKEAISAAYAKKHGLSKAFVLECWENSGKASREMGTLVHEYAEDLAQEIYNDGKLHMHTAERALMDLGVGVPSPHIMNVTKFLNDMQNRYMIIGAEIGIVSVENKPYRGTLDLLVEDKNNGELVIFDYKTNSSLTDSYGNKKLYEPFNDLIDMPINRYSIQQSLYMLALKRMGVNTSRAFLVATGVDKKGYHLHECVNLVERLENEGW